MRHTIRIIEEKASGFIIQHLKTKEKAYIPKDILSTKIKSGYYYLIESVTS